MGPGRRRDTLAAAELNNLCTHSIERTSGWHAPTMTHSPAKLVDLRAKSSVLIYSQSVDEQSTPSGTRFAHPIHEQQSSSGRELSSGRLESGRPVQLLSAVPPLQSLAPDELSALAEGLKVYNFDASAVIIHRCGIRQSMYTGTNWLKLRAQIGTTARYKPAITQHSRTKKSTSGRYST